MYVGDLRLHVVRRGTRGSGKSVVNVEMRLPCLVLFMRRRGRCARDKVKMGS
jgi:hypothetical protein